MNTKKITALAGIVVAVLGCGDGRTPLVVYSTHGREMLIRAEAIFEELNPEVDLRWLDMGSQDVLDRVRSEKVNPQADVWFGGPSYILARAVSDSLLEPFRPSWAEFIPERAQGAGDFYFAAYETPAIIEYNTAALSADSVPTDWDEVLDPKWAGRIVIRDPIASGTMRSIFGMVIQKSIRETGDTAQGFDWLRALDAQTREYVRNPTMLHEKMVRQDGVLTLWALPDVLVDANAGDPLGYVLPTSGTPVIEDAIALVRGSDQQELGKRFIEWVGSVDAQLMAANLVFRLPTRTDLPLDSLADWVRDVREKMVVAEMDWDELAVKGPEWMLYWDRHVRGQGAP
jgi:iron(III) transport system substrate-binding protein